MSSPPAAGRLPDDAGTHAPPTLLYLVKRLELAVRIRLDEVLRPYAVTTTQYTALTVLVRREGLSTAELARNSFVTDQSAADLVAGLEQRGLVSRVPDPKDRRRRVLRLTDKSRHLLDQVRPKVAAIEEQMLAPLAPVEAENLRQYVQLCRRALAGPR